MARSRLIPSVAIAAVVALGSFLAPGAASASESTVTVSGRLTLLSEGESTFERATLSVSGRGYLSVDLSGLADKDELGWGAPVRLDLVVPEGLPASIVSDDDFAALATYSTTVAPLVASSGAPLSFGPRNGPSVH